MQKSSEAAEKNHADSDSVIEILEKHVKDLKEQLMEQAEEIKMLKDTN